MYWTNVQRNEQNVLTSRELCQKSKYAQENSQGVLQSIIPEAPLDLVSVDIFGPLPKSKAGVQYVFVMEDLLSKFTKLYPVVYTNAQILLGKVRSFVEELENHEQLYLTMAASLLVTFGRKDLKG
ncbi:hypothetical protein PR048_000074 [Dryococelus australis]|uniref:Uncharacterized protein n=1 Tax=Dryococelus australis TaxID=614101 RepID=A0ABQ9IDL9_9NEOP|nr:hypothetical protein PR048_000074 [Dryococelus australis]